ncbi:MAG: thiol:disulfide interchange protein DsbA/DsbL [Rudaea sp.]|uniref:thiol:disulfide interchange protein DsbA/DsbL n=1 Tax=unclassified Rudaea TaxID=2627037 RepID=UPI0010F6D108|nr:MULTISPECIES: thiol:disulfide interchange protein DsbA/DsbL [unclassified Rudaea]MBN8887045.1 thiol:disulfide interchange protein DsbA/DsbL [Rudaea sp.]MBR0344635.1 thiol:disulfide interchange protein DsbA/DsbL [Rudaea sp.]
MFARLLTALFASAVIAPLAQAQAPAAAPAWKEGTHYFVVEPTVPSESGDGKIEVTEVFSYGCPACNFFYPTINKLKKALPPNAVMNFVPASFNPSEDWPMFQRAYLTAVTLGIAEKSHDAMFDAVWKPNAPLAIMNPDGRTLKKPLPSIEDAAKFYAQYGVKAEDFVATANSFAINAKMKRADAFLKATMTDSTPTIVVGGKYRFNPGSAGGEDKVVPLTLYLIQQAASAK